MSPGNAAPVVAPAVERPQRGRRWLRLGLFGCGSLVLLMVVTVGLISWWISRHLSPPPIKPVFLSAQEQFVLDQKASLLRGFSAPQAAPSALLGQMEGEQPYESGSGARPDPEEAIARGEQEGWLRKNPDGPPSVRVSQRELNGLLNKNTKLGERVELSLGTDTVGAHLNIDVPEDFPVLSGKQVRVDVALQAALVDERLQLRVADVSLGGFPVPNAWLGGVKGMDLVEKYQESGVMQAFVAGIEELEISPQEILLTPAE